MIVIYAYKKWVIFLKITGKISRSGKHVLYERSLIVSYEKQLKINRTYVRLIRTYEQSKIKLVRR